MHGFGFICQRKKQCIISTLMRTKRPEYDGNALSCLSSQHSVKYLPIFYVNTYPRKNVLIYAHAGNMKFLNHSGFIIVLYL